MLLGYCSFLPLHVLLLELLLTQEQQQATDLLLQDSLVAARTVAEQGLSMWAQSRLAAVICLMVESTCGGENSI